MNLQDVPISVLGRSHLSFLEAPLKSSSFEIAIDGVPTCNGICSRKHPIVFNIVSMPQRGNVSCQVQIADVDPLWDCGI